MLTSCNSLALTYLNEMGHIRTNFARAPGKGFSKDLPLLLFVVAENEKTPEGLEPYYRQAESVRNGTVVACPARTIFTTRRRGRLLLG